MTEVLVAVALLVAGLVLMQIGSQDFEWTMTCEAGHEVEGRGVVALVVMWIGRCPQCRAADA